MQRTIQISTASQNGLYDITRQVEALVAESGIREGMVNVYAQGATAAIMIQENWDESVQEDVITLLRKLIPPGVWQHDRQDNNGDAHLKAGIVGPQETIPIVGGKMGLSTWQNIFFCEFDGPRSRRTILVPALPGLLYFPDFLPPDRNLLIKGLGAVCKDQRIEAIRHGIFPKPDALFMQPRIETIFRLKDPPARHVNEKDLHVLRPFEPESQADMV
jgi:secondary thiamine-phosphate synthase enzyme